MNANAAEHYDALMLDYAAGALSPALTLLVEAHLQLQPKARLLARAADDIGGELLERQAPAPMAAQPLPGARLVHIEPPQIDPRIQSARARIALGVSDDSALTWKWRPGLSEHKLPLPGMSLLKIKPGAAMPAHGHSGEEVTLVLRGAFADEIGRYGPGDIAFADAATHHQPRVVGAETCICLAVMEGEYAFNHWLPRLAARFFQ